MSKAIKKVRINTGILIISKNKLLLSLDWEKYGFTFLKPASGFDYCLIETRRPFSLTKLPLSSSAKVLFILSATTKLSSCPFPYQILVRPDSYDVTILPSLVNRLLNPNLYIHSASPAVISVQRPRPKFLRILLTLFLLVLLLLPVSLLSAYTNFQCQFRRLTDSNPVSWECQVADYSNRFTETFFIIKPLYLFHSLSQVTFDLHELNHLISNRQNIRLNLFQIQSSLSQLQSDLKISQRNFIYQTPGFTRLISQTETLQIFFSNLSKLLSLSPKYPASLILVIRDNFDLDSAGGKPLGKYEVSVDSQGLIRRTENSSSPITIELPLSTLYLLINSNNSLSDFVSTYHQQLQISPLRGVADFTDSLITSLMDQINLHWQDRGQELTFRLVDLLSFDLPTPTCPDPALCVIDQFDFIRENTSSLKPDLFLDVTKNIHVGIDPENITYLVDLSITYYPPNSSWPAGDASYLLKIVYPSDLLLASTDPAATTFRLPHQLGLSYPLKLVPGKDYSLKLRLSRPNPSPEKLKYTLVLPQQPAALNEKLEITISYPKNLFVYVTPKPRVASPGILQYNLGTDKTNLLTLDLIPPQL